jgi:hypothetical protein
MTPQQQFLKVEFPALTMKLHADTQPIWGQMSAQHMMEHVSALLYISLGKKPFPLMVPEEHLEKSRQWLMSPKEFRPGTQGPGLPSKPGPLRFTDIEEAREKLLGSMQRFLAHFEENPEFEVMHPAFGMLGKAEWEQFHYKHIRHHYSQFGLIPLSDYYKEKLGKAGE